MSGPPERGASKGEEGAALLTAVFFVALIGLMAALILATLHLRSLSLSRQADQIEAGFLAETATSFAILALKDQAGEPAALRNLACETADGYFEVRIEDEAGKLDLNTGRLDLLEALFGRLDRSDLYGKVFDRRRAGEPFEHIGQLVSRNEDPQLFGILDRSVTTHSQLAGIATDRLSAHPDSEILRSVLGETETASIDSPRQVFRLKVSVRTENGFEHGQVVFVRMVSVGNAARVFGRFGSVPVFLSKRSTIAPACLSSK